MSKIENCYFRPRRSDVSDVRVADPGRLRRLFPAEPLRDEVIPWPPGGRYIKQIIIVIIFCLKKNLHSRPSPAPLHLRVGLWQLALELWHLAQTSSASFFRTSVTKSSSGTRQ